MLRNALLLTRLMATPVCGQIILLKFIKNSAIKSIFVYPRFSMKRRAKILKFWTEFSHRNYFGYEIHRFHVQNHIFVSTTLKRINANRKIEKLRDLLIKTIISKIQNFLNFPNIFFSLYVSLTISGERSWRLRHKDETYQNSPSAIFRTARRSRSTGGTSSHSRPPLVQAPTYSPTGPSGFLNFTNCTASPLKVSTWTHFLQKWYSNFSKKN